MPRTSTLLILALLLAGASASPILRRDGPSTSSANITTTITAGHTCRSFTAPISATADNIAYLLPEPENQQAMIQEVYVDGFETAPFAPECISNGTTRVSDTYELFFKYCEPTAGVTKSSVIHTIHGLVGTADYWDVVVDGDDSYSFVKAATDAGYAVLTYDRLGVRNSFKPLNGILTNQLSLQTAIALQITFSLRNDALGLGRNFSSVVGVGHSFGSATLLNAASREPEAFDGIVLTGFSANSSVTPLSSILGFQHKIAAETDVYEWRNLSNSYLVTGSQSGDQLGFFSYPNYTHSAIDLFTETKGTYTIGELLSVRTPSPALNYTNPLQVVTGDRDTVFCSGNCYDNPTSVGDVKLTSKLDTVRLVFPEVGEKFETYAVPGTGHGINFHPTAAGAYSKILDFLAKYEL
ncbi:hypothetical protein MNV49_005715 [Pseudohyphozyma bogoriensis]|nr:hypothetical protein MNV49_005715 [Pseudohyphozyma bogoriensis]